MPAFQRMLDFVELLKRDKLHFEVLSYRSEAVTITISVPGQRIEIELFADREPEVEFFSSNGQLYDLAELEKRLTSLEYSVQGIRDI